MTKTICSYLNLNGYETAGCLSAAEAYAEMYKGDVFDLFMAVCSSRRLKRLNSGGQN